MTLQNRRTYWLSTRESIMSHGQPLSLVSVSLVILLGFWATTLAQPNVLARIPLQNFLKNVLHFDRSSTAAFFFWIGLPWYIKPLIGVFSDAYPVLGSRRRSYLIIGCLIAVGAWCFLSVSAYSYRALLITCMIINLAIVVASTALGGYLVEIAQASERSGRISSLRNVGYQSAMLLSGVGGGFLGAVAMGWTAFACGSIAFSAIPVAWWLMRERYHEPAGAKFATDFGSELRVMGRASALWGVAALAALYYIAPGLSTALFYLQQNTMHLDTQHQGYLNFCGGAAGLLAAIVYGLVVARRISLRTLLVACLTQGAAVGLLYLWYDRFGIALMIEAANGLAGGLCEIVIIHAAVRATPVGSEALGFAVFMAVRNLLMWGSDWLGSAMIDELHIQLSTLIFINAGTTLLAAPLALLLPRHLVDARDMTTAPTEETQKAARIAEA